MDHAQGVKFLSELTKVPVSQSRAGWVVAHCPMAEVRHSAGTDSNPSFGMKIEAGDPFVSCFSCGYHGTASGMLFDMQYYALQGVMEQRDFRKAFELVNASIENTPILEEKMSYEEALSAVPGQMTEFPEWWLDTFVAVSKSHKAMTYLKKRNVTEALATALDLRFDSSQKRLCFPVRDFDGVLRGLHGRDVLGTAALRYRMYTLHESSNPIVWLGEHWLDPSKPMIVVEGPFDVASVLRVYRNVASPLFANPSMQKIARMSHVKEWVTLLDPGKAGDNGRDKISKALGAEHTVVHLVPPEGEDPGSMSEKDLRELLDPVMDLDDDIYGDEE